MRKTKTCAVLLWLASAGWASGAQTGWTPISSARGDLPVPAGSHQQTGALVADLDQDGADDFVLAFRVKAPALAWFRRTAGGWTQQIIEKTFLTLEAGGAAHDIDGDGDLDIVFGEDAQGNRLWWWENPHPRHDPRTPWTRRVIKDGGANQHHDQIFADFIGSGRPQLAFWNQRAKTLFLASVPPDPRNAGPWPRDAIHAGQAGEQVEGAARYAEGLDAFDVDSDGRLDLLAGHYWFRNTGAGQFVPIQVGVIGGRIRAGRFTPGPTAQIVIAPGDGNGPLRLYEAAGDPTASSSWVGRDLLEREMIHGHTLELGDVDGDGHLDVFAAEMAKWTNGPAVDHPGAAAWILHGDGAGNFRTTILKTGDGWHEGKLGDFDGDGDLDILNKPYTWNAPRVDLWINSGSTPEP
jgi:hypothetical protein